MGIHIGKIIQKEVSRKHLSYKEFGALLHRDQKEVSDIYDSEFLPTNLLLDISTSLKIDFISFYYKEEPLKSLRNDQVVGLNNQIEILTEKIKDFMEEISLLKNELTMRVELNEVLKGNMSLAMEQIEQYKQKLANISHC